MLPDLPTYERLVYTLQQSYLSIQQSTLVVVRHGPAFAELTGTLMFEGDVTLAVWEDLNFARRVIQGYSYTVSRAAERLYWYDPQPHSNDPTLAATFPHHKHVPPDPSTGSGQSIKRHRIPAPDLSFTRPNLPFLIAETERDLLG